MSLKHTATKAAIALFRAVRATKRGIERLGHEFGRAFGPLGRLLSRLLILPAYRVIVFMQLKVRRLMTPTRGFAIFFVGNKYLFHGVLAVAAISTVVLNLQAQQANAQDVGKNSLLYALATNSDVEIVQEAAPDAIPKESKYVTGALEAVPHVDFDYSTDEPTQQIADLSVPGAISANLLPEGPGGSTVPRTKTDTYVVKEGDTIGSIAQKFNVNVGTILWSNNLGEREYIRPGDSLRIPPVSGLLVTIKKGDTVAKLASRYQADADAILSFNKIANESSLSLGTELVIPDGKPPEPVPTVIAARTRATERATTQQPTASSAVSSGPRPKNADDSSLSKTKILWPTPGHVITQYYGWKHTGVDIDGDFTSPLYAAYDGVVTTAGWNNGGYGLQVIVDHPNGMRTRYAHSSKLFVKVGDQVKRGQVIAMMGSTGRSTGSHLHFEVYVNGIRTNPLAYIR